MYEFRDKHTRLLRNPSTNNFSVKIFSPKSTKYSIFIRQSKIWNEFLIHEEKPWESHWLFLRNIKSSLLDNENERKHKYSRSINLGLDDKVL